jgi:hypothetical protein
MNAEKILIGAILQSRGEYLDDCYLIADDFMNRQEQLVFAAGLLIARFVLSQNRSLCFLIHFEVEFPVA